MKRLSMADGKCDKCGVPTSNMGDMFRCEFGMVDYRLKGAKMVKTTTSVTQNKKCVLCDDCISAYVETIKKGNGNITAPVIGMVLTGIIGGLFSLMGGVIRVLCIAGIAVCCFFG